MIACVSRTRFGWLWLVAAGCTPNAFGTGDMDPSSVGDVSSSGGDSTMMVATTTPSPTGTGGEGATTEPTASATASTEASGGSSSSGGTPLVCGEVLGEAEDCPDSCTSCMAGVCEMKCQGERACAEQRVECPPGTPCNVLCGGPEACVETTVVCPSDQPCVVECYGIGSCTELQLECGGGPCMLHCNAASSCDEADVHCGPNDSRIGCSGRLEGSPVVHPYEGDGDGGDEACACEIDEEACGPART